MTEKVDYAYVAYLDILGYKELLDTDVRAGTQTFKERMIKAFKVFDNINQSRYPHKAISDSIFISCSERAAAKEFLCIVRDVYVSFLAEGLLIRGGVSFGQHFETQAITYSPVLTKAYLLESEIAEFPRIMVDSNVYDMFPYLKDDGIILRTGNHWFLNVATVENFANVWDAAVRTYISSKPVIQNSERVRIKHRWLQDFLIEVTYKLGIAPPQPYLRIFDEELIPVESISGAPIATSHLAAHEDDSNRPHRPEENFRINDYDKIFKLTESVEFYNAIAEFYDERNTQDYEKTYDLIHSLCQDYKGDLSGIRVLDLGGGTGALLKKFRHHNLYWADVDLAQNALSVFENNYAESGKSESRPFDIVNGSYANPNEKFDIVIMSFVLSSLPVNFPFGILNKLMAPDAILIIADNHPHYSTGKLYGFKGVRGKNYALKIKIIDPSVLKTEIENEGFIRKNIQYVYAKEDRVYSHVQVYKLI